MKIGFNTSQTNIDWPTLLATWELGDELTVSDSAWIFNHVVALGDADQGLDGLRHLVHEVAEPLRERFG
jgi:hypothetical protein